MKNLIYIIITLVVGWFALNYIAQKTVQHTNELIADEIHTSWVKAAKECNNTIIAVDSINTEDGDELR